NKADGVRALRAVHQAFGLADRRPGAGVPVADGKSRSASSGSATSNPQSAIGMADLTQRLTAMEDILVTDVLLNTDQGRISVFGLPNHPGTCSRVFQAVAAGGIVVDMIVQNLTEDVGHVSFSVPQADLSRAMALTQQAAAAVDPRTRVTGDANIATLFVLGV